MAAKTFSPLALILLPFLLSGCAVRLLGPYEPLVDSGVTEIQQKVQGMLFELARNVNTDAGKYDKYVGTYDGLKVKLSSIRMRADAYPKNERTVQQLDLLKENLNLLEKMHKNGLTGMEIPAIEDAMNRTCGAVLKLEIAKKDFRAKTAQ